jgi:hypothetical protein
MWKYFLRTISWVVSSSDALSCGHFTRPRVTAFTMNGR